MNDNESPKNFLSESDTKAKFIDPCLKLAGWDENSIIREYYFTDGRKLAGGQRGSRLFLDYLLHYQNIKLAVIEAKRIGKHPTSGLSQAIEYAQKLGVRFVYATNGQQFYEFDIKFGSGDYINSMPSPENLLQRYYSKQDELKRTLQGIPFYLTGDKSPRYYQEVAVNSAVGAIADNKKRILLTLATGTGKTFISFQIVHKLFEAKWNIDGSDCRPRILFLADRNVLADQAINTFNDPYEKDLAKINGEEIRIRNGKVPTNAYLFFAIYQAIAEKENIGGFYKEYPKDFFDLVIIDECHRGAANDEGSWRSILDHFDRAVHLGLTATPKRSDNVDTYKYFGKPVYEYSLRNGIEDGFLTPYKVKRVRTNLDEYIHTHDDQVIRGEVEKDKYDMPDFERNIVIYERSELVAKAILNNIKPLDKTIVFCVDQNHALRMRDAINKHKTIKDPHYCVRITSDEQLIGRQMLEMFQDNDKDIPAIITSSQMLTTGVDARNVRNIVLIRTIQSMVEFKQIVGRGTRIFDGKDYFTIIDFTGATELFYDEEWDGLPEEEPAEETMEEALKEEASVHDIATGEPGDETDNEKPPRKEKLEIRLSHGRTLRVIDVETRYIGPDGKPITATEFLETIIGLLPDIFTSEQQLRERWANPDTRKELLQQLADHGVDKDHLQTMQKMFEAEDSDVFDVLAHIAFNASILRRHDRAENARNDVKLLKGCNTEVAKNFVLFLLERYEKDGVQELDRDNLSEIIRISQLGTVRDLQLAFGGKEQFLHKYYDVQYSLYEVREKMKDYA